MAIRFFCPSCGRRLWARNDEAGKHLKCPGCQKEIPVPTTDQDQTEEFRRKPPPPER